MRALTRKSPHGEGYSAESRDIPELIAKMGRIEATAYDALSDICAKYCKYESAFAKIPGGIDRLIPKCEACPVDRLANLIYKGDIGYETTGEEI